jgi:hypothetical protein
MSLVVLLIGAAVWALMRAQADPVARTSLVVYENLVPAYRDAEFYRTTANMNLGSLRGQRYTVEAQTAPGRRTPGFLSRPEEQPPFAWLVGRTVGFDLDVVQPRDRSLRLFLASALDRHQDVEVSFNGHLLRRMRLRADRHTAGVRMEVPVDLQRPGRNRITLAYDGVQRQSLEGIAGQLPLAGRIYGMRFLPPAEEDAFSTPTGGQLAPRAGRSYRTSDGHLVTELTLPAGLVASLAVELPQTSRVVLRYSVERLDTGFDLTLMTDRGERRSLKALPRSTTDLGSGSVNLSNWRGQVVRLNARATPGTGEVVLRGLSLMVAEGALPEARPSEGRLEVLEEGARPRLAWTRGDVRLEVDLSTRQRQLFDLSAAEGKNFFRERPVIASLLYRELCTHVTDDEQLPDEWSLQLRALLQRQ